MGKKPIQPQDKYILRMPDGMRDRIKRAAEKNNRSMNAEIVAALEEAFPEGYTITDWINEWMPQLAAATDPGERDALVERAMNAAAGTGFVVEISNDETKSGTGPKPVFTFIPVE